MTVTVSTWAARTFASVTPGVFTRLPAESRTVFLTFDDGPSSRTGELLDLLSEARASATFFLLGDKVERHPDMARRIANSRHRVANHSFQHLDAWRNRWHEIEADLDRGNSIISDLTGGVVEWMRPPFGRIRPGTLAWCRKNSRHLALWDVMATDFTPEVEVEAAAVRVVGKVRPGSIVVLHDGDSHHPHALEVTRRVVSSLVESGWSFAALPASPHPVAG